MLNSFYVDLHIHIGQTKYGKPVKITASKKLTLTNILKEASERKGLDMVGIIDAHVPAVQEELEDLIQEGKAKALKKGGIRYENVTLLLGTEIELYDQNCHGPIHVLCFFPTLTEMKAFTKWFQTKVTNVHLSSQRIYSDAITLQEKTKELQGLFIPAHVFTPFKSLYGKGVMQSLKEVFNPEQIDAIELGLSADTDMADQIKELHAYPYLTNSDAHSLPKIAREYNELLMEEPTFDELKKALRHEDGRKVLVNYGMNPLLGKYHTTVCANCHEKVKGEIRCPNCGKTDKVKGVFDRITELKNTNQKAEGRPPYNYQIPLEYLPKLGPKTYEKLLNHVGTEMFILHEATKEQLQGVLSKQLVEAVLAIRKGDFSIEAGGGGKYGRLK